MCAAITVVLTRSSVLGWACVLMLLSMRARAAQVAPDFSCRLLDETYAEPNATIGKIQNVMVPPLCMVADSRAAALHPTGLHALWSYSVSSTCDGLQRPAC